MPRKLFFFEFFQVCKKWWKKWCKGCDKKHLPPQFANYFENQKNANIDLEKIEIKIQEIEKKLNKVNEGRKTIEDFKAQVKAPIHFFYTHAKKLYKSPK